MVHLLHNKPFILLLATIVKSGTIPNFENVENHNGKSKIFGSGDPINQRSAFAFNTGQNHTGATQKKVIYEILNRYGQYAVLIRNNSCLS